MIALFPGKFQPPHIGHVISIVRIYEKYNKIIIGITDDGPIVMEQRKRVEMMQEVFRFMPKVKVIPLMGVLTEYTNSSLLPDFDVCLSGNKKVIEKIRLLGLKAEFLNRSNGIGFSGTEIRSLI